MIDLKMIGNHPVRHPITDKELENILKDSNVPTLLIELNYIYKMHNLKPTAAMLSWNLYDPFMYEMSKHIRNERFYHTPEGIVIFYGMEIFSISNRTNYLEVLI